MARDKQEPKGKNADQAQSGKQHRRGHGEGSIVQLPDGRWQARVDLGYVNGKRQRKAYYGATRKEAADQLTKALRDLQLGLPVAVDGNLTVGKFLERWLEDAARPTIRPSTFASYHDLVRLHLIPALGRFSLQKLSPPDVQAMLNAKAQERDAKGQPKYSPRRVQMMHAVLRRALGTAEKWGLVGRNVARLADPPRSRRDEVEPFTPEQTRKLLDAARGTRGEALYAVAVALGLRQGEALGLRWQDVDLEAGTLRVRQAVQRVKHKLVIAEPKTTRSRRAVMLPAIVVKALREHRIRQLAERLSTGPAWQEHDLVFPSTIGTPADSRNVIREYHKLLGQAGLPRRPFHNLRHTAATLLMAQGVDLRTVMETLGHSQISLTANLYAHVMPTLKTDAAAKMDAILTGP